MSSVPLWAIITVEPPRARDTEREREREKSKPDEGGGGGGDEITPVLVAD